MYRYVSALLWQCDTPCEWLPKTRSMTEYITYDKINGRISQYREVHRTVFGPRIISDRDLSVRYIINNYYDIAGRNIELYVTIPDVQYIMGTYVLCELPSWRKGLYSGTTKSYSGGVIEEYHWDRKGRLVSVYVRPSGTRLRTYDKHRPKVPARELGIAHIKWLWQHPKSLFVKGRRN